MPKEAEPSKRSLREIPEVDLSRARRLRRGKYAAKARRSFAVAIVEPELFARFGSSEAINDALRAVVEEGRKPKADPMAKRTPGIPGPTHLSRTVRYVTTCGPN